MRVRRTGIAFGLLAAGGLGSYVLGVALVAGRLKAQRLVTSFCYPASLLLFALVFVTAYAWFVRRERVLGRWLFAVTLGYLLAGNGLLVNSLLASLERPFYSVRPLDGPVYDAVLVLGGGVGVAPDRVSPELHEAGTRVALAARMVHSGKARHLIVLGSSKPADERAAPSPVGLTMTILRQFGCAGRRAACRSWRDHAAGGHGGARAGGTARVSARGAHHFRLASAAGDAVGGIGGAECDPLRPIFGRGRWRCMRISGCRAGMRWPIWGSWRRNGWRARGAVVPIQILNHGEHGEHGGITEKASSYSL